MTITSIRTAPEPAVAPGFRRLLRGNMQAPIVVVCDPPKINAIRAGLPIDADCLKLFARYAFGSGFTKDDFLFVALCPPLTPDMYSSASRKWKHVEPHTEEIWERIRETNPRAIVTFGELASRVVLGRSTAITKARGKAVRHEDYLVLPMLPPSMILRVPDHEPTFASDIQTLARLRADNYTISEQVDHNVNYEWREDIGDIVEAMELRIAAGEEPFLAVDTETTGLRWHDPSVRVLTVQICWAPGQVAVCPVDPAYWPEWIGRPRHRARLLSQLRRLIANPSVRCIGHNLKFDIHMLRKLDIETANWSDDTQVKAFAVDENMMEKSLDECTRRWVEPMAGYADAFNQTVDKARMVDVPRDKMLPYAGGDPDATYRLNEVLTDLLHRDLEQEKCYKLIQMPGMRAFADMVERHGMLVDQQRLTTFGAEVQTFLDEAYPSLIRRVPAPVRMKHLEAGKELSFGRPDFTKDVLFTKGIGGFELEPLVWTKTTKDLEDVTKREPSTSSKQHLPFFSDPSTSVGTFVLDLIDFRKTTTLSNNFIGTQAEGNGLWQYISPITGKIYPSYMLHRTVTGRTASADPNGQNFPKRGRWAKAYQSIFKASPGFKLINADLSQIELRIAAWMANEQAMLRIYREGGDIHAATGQYVAGLNDAQWAALTAKERKRYRQDAKAVNFGFLYGMGARKFRAFAKTDYDVTFTERESYMVRERFFQLYAGLPQWHNDTREFVRANGYVRALHGAVRHLPSIWSNDEMVRSESERQAINSPVQRFGSDLGVMSLARFAEQADQDIFRIIGFVHDALVMEVRDGYEQEGVEALLYAMQSNPLQQCFGLTPPIPIIAEADIGLDGGRMLEFADLPPINERPDWFNNLGFDRVQPRRPEWWDVSLDEEWTYNHLSS
jgi:uracil-DNA glycosylase family 4